MSKINNILEYIVEKSNAPEDFILQCEERYNNKINNIAQQIHEKAVSEIVMIAGPSSAGKTTTAKMQINFFTMYSPLIYNLN